MMFFTHDFGEHSMGNKIFFVSTNYLAHTVIMLALFLFWAMPCADVPVYQVERMESFDLVSYTMSLDSEISFDF
jgi:hypothetical protein